MRTSIVVALAVVGNIFVQLGFLRGLYFCFCVVKASLLSWISWPQPSVERVGKYHIVTFTVNNKKCKLICREGPYVIDIMRDAETSVKSELEPFCVVTPVDVTQPRKKWEAFSAIILGRSEPQTLYLPPRR